MANELIEVRGSQTVLESNGASVANNAISAAATNIFDRDIGSGIVYPYAEFALTLAFATAPIVNGLIELLAVPQDIDGTTDSPVPTATYREQRIGYFVVKDQTASQTLFLAVKSLPKRAAYYLYNSGTTQAINTGWVLKATALTLKPAA